MDVERGRTVKGWRPRRLGEHVLLRLGLGSCPWGLLSFFFFFFWGGGRFFCPFLDPLPASCPPFPPWLPPPLFSASFFWSVCLFWVTQ